VGRRDTHAGADVSKLKNPVGRSTDEWVGKSADTWPPPEAVQLRVLLRQHGKCAITGHKFAPGDEKQLDHIIALADWTGEGHGNRESNLQWLLDALAHKPKTAAENSARAPVIQRAKTHAGIRSEKKVKVARRPKPERSTAKLDGLRAMGPPALARQGFESIGNITSRIVAELNPKKAAE
jgi:5-methylcytosine-specific restriction enzyme A